MFLSSFSQAVLHRENLKIPTLSECNDLPNHPRSQKKNQNLFWWEHKAICRNQDATCLPSELHNLCKRNNCMLLIVNYIQLSAEDEDVTKTGNEEAENRPEEREKSWKIVHAPCLSNIPGGGTKRAKFTKKNSCVFSKEKKTKQASKRANSWSRSGRKVIERVKNSLSFEGLKKKRTRGDQRISTTFSSF